MLLLSVLTALSVAQDVPETSGNVQTLHPSVDAEQTLWTDDASLAESGTFGARVLGSWTHRPLVYEVGGEATAIVASAWQVDVLGSATVGPVRIGVDVPLILSATSDLAQPSVAGLGDVALDAKIGVVRPDQGLGVALSGRVGLPTGGALRVPLGASAPSWEAAAILHYQLGKVRLVTNLGTRGGPPIVLGDREIGDQFFARAGLGVPVGDRLGLSGDVALRAPYSAPFALGAPAEWAVGGWAQLSDWLTLRLGAGRGLTGAVGAPAARALVSLGYRPPPARPEVQGVAQSAVAAPSQPRRDADGDGVSDSEDRCPEQPEDGDGWEEADGCPEPVRLAVSVQDYSGATVHGAFTWLDCGTLEARLPAVAEAEVAAGICNINVAAPGWTYESHTLEVIDGPPVDHVSTLNPIRQMGYVEVEVVGPDGAPVAGAQWRVDGGIQLPLRLGRARLVLAPGDYEVGVEGPGFAATRARVVVEAGAVRPVRVTLQRP